MPRLVINGGCRASGVPCCPRTGSRLVARGLSRVVNRRHQHPADRRVSRVRTAVDRWLARCVPAPRPRMAPTLSAPRTLRGTPGTRGSSPSSSAPSHCELGSSPIARRRRSRATATVAPWSVRQRSPLSYGSGRHRGGAGARERLREAASPPHRPRRSADRDAAPVRSRRRPSRGSARTHPGTPPARGRAVSCRAHVVAAFSWWAWRQPTETSDRRRRRRSPAPKLDALPPASLVVLFQSQGPRPDRAANSSRRTRQSSTECRCGGRPHPDPRIQPRQVRIVI